MPLNGITLGQTLTDPINRMITISKLASTYVGYERLNWDLVSMDKFDSINRLIPLTVVTLSGAHFISNILNSHKNSLNFKTLLRQSN